MGWHCTGMKKLIKPARLVLATETVRSLSLSELALAGGGHGGTQTRMMCASKVAESCGQNA